MRFALLSRLAVRRVLLWQELLSESLDGKPVLLAPPHGSPTPAECSTVEVLFAADPAQGQLGVWPAARLIQSLWAGVDGLLADPTLPPNVQIARLIDPAMAADLAESALAHVLSLHRQMHRYRAQASLRIWQPLAQPRAAERTVGIMGLGRMGTPAAVKIASMGFRVRGWSGSQTAIEGVEVFAGEEGLSAFLAGTDILVNLLPLTPRTDSLLDRDRLALLPAGASLINLGRGRHLVLPDLLEALQEGRMDHAILDVFSNEPLSAEDALWEHPSITIMPHVAATTDPKTAAVIAARNAQRFLRGQQPEGVVPRDRGY